MITVSIADNGCISKLAEMGVTMARYNAMEETYTEIRVLGKPALFHDMRLDQDYDPFIESNN